MKTKEQKTSGKTNNNSPFFKSQKEGGFIGLQPKLKVGEPGDKYEQEADRVAYQVVQNSNERQGFFGDSGFLGQANRSNNIQEKPLAEKVSPLVQQQEEEEEAQAKQIQKQEEEEELQMQPMEEEEEMIQPQQEEEEIQASRKDQNSVSAPIENTLNENSGGGEKMDAATRSEMEKGFGTDFGSVNIHTDSAALQMSQQLGAQAFTHGNNIYFNNGKYNPQSRQGKHLLAHELTHTLQQSGGLQRKRISGNIQSTGLNIQGSFEGNVGDSIENAGTDFVMGQFNDWFETLQNFFVMPLPNVTTRGVPVNFVVLGNGGPVSISLHGTTEPHFDGGTGQTENLSTTRATDCDNCEDDECLLASGTLVLVFQSDPVVTLPSRSEYDHLTPCQIERVEQWIRDVLAPHEQDHVDAFNTYNGTVRQPFSIKTCRNDWGPDSIQPIHERVEQQRRQSAQHLSDSLDPFHTNIDLNCED